MGDFRLAFRSLRATPVATAVAVLSLALGIGANTAIFSLLDAILLRSLPVRDPASLVMLIGGNDGTSTYWSQPVFREVSDRRLLDDEFAWSEGRFDLASGGESHFVEGVLASGGLFRTLGVRPAIGRLLTESDDQPAGGPDGLVAVISDRFWQRQYSGALDVIGRSIAISRVPFTIVGVSPPGFTGVDVGLPFDVAIPLATEARFQADKPCARDWSSYVAIMGRLRSGQTAIAATASLRAAQPAIRDATNTYTISPYREQYLRAPLTFRSSPVGHPGVVRRSERPFIILRLGVEVRRHAALRSRAARSGHAHRFRRDACCGRRPRGMVARASRVTHRSGAGAQG